MRFQVLTAASMTMRAFWDVAPCSMGEVDRRFRNAYCLKALMIEGVRTSETSVYFETTRRYIPESYLRLDAMLLLDVFRDGKHCHSIKVTSRTSKPMREFSSSAKAKSYDVVL
jgi:hypothetical protein